MDKNLISPVEPDPFEPEVNAFWTEMGKDLVRGSTASLDESARQIIGVAGILEGLYFHAIAFSDLRGTLQEPLEFAIYLAPALLLLFSLSAALLVFFPDRYPLDIRAPKAAQVVHKRVVKSKHALLRLAAVSLMLAVAALFVAMMVYLKG